VIVDYGDQPRMVGVATLRRFLERRFAPVLDYELRKHALAAHADHIVAELDIRSRASVPGAPALRARGLEFLVIRERRVAVWKMTINPHPDGP
jgi:limonene-1,2-epoxide hydrolase